MKILAFRVERKEAIKASKQDDTIWKNAASEVCKLLGEVRESGRQGMDVYHRASVAESKNHLL